MLSWIASFFAGGVAKAVFGIFGDVIVQPILQAYLKSKDVDMVKYQATEASTVQLATAVLAANVQFAAIKSQYALAVLQWWPFRAILFCLLAFTATRFTLVLVDSTWWWIFGCTIDGVRTMGDACSWSIPALKGSLAGVEVELLLFFIIAKPVDTAVTGAINLVSRYMAK